VDNWTCDEFVGFVRDCTDVVDGLEIDPDSETGKQAEEVGCSLEHLSSPSTTSVQSRTNPTNSSHVQLSTNNLSAASLGLWAGCEGTNRLA
jgi:hypothetical protein